MVLYPDIQKQAQAEIDAVIGNDRLPTIEDRGKLPYVSALAMEVLRWHIVAPTGGPHRAMKDDIHDGYFIPKGAIVLPNVWKMGHDASIYKSPWSFDPARFIKTEDHEPEPDPRSICFGFGRRICPGRILGDVSTFISCAMTLAVFDITPYTKDGKPVIPDLEQSTGVISHTSKFKCNIVPRSQEALALVDAVVEQS
ncbi:hypothetical protein AX15_006144 [Amanita polypyramis BW_CC]|nr:hypothetical protein AX15_006144 [Amanita polypyramis BW_CC]